MNELCITDLDEYVEKLGTEKKIIIPGNVIASLAQLKNDSQAGAILFAAILWQMNGTEPAAFEGIEKLAVELTAEQIGVFGPDKEE